MWITLNKSWWKLNKTHVHTCAGLLCLSPDMSAKHSGNDHVGSALSPLMENDNHGVLWVPHTAELHSPKRLTF